MWNRYTTNSDLPFRSALALLFLSFRKRFYLVFDCFWPKVCYNPIIEHMFDYR